MKEMFSNDENELLKSITTLEQERLGIIELRSRNPHLYSYYLDWLIVKEKKLIKKYEKKYWELPDFEKEVPAIPVEC